MANTKAGAPDAGIKVWHPHVLQRLLQEWWSPLFPSTAPAAGTSLSHNVCRWRPVCTWGLVVWTGFINLPTKAHFCNNQGTQAILVPLQLHGHAGSHCQGRAVQAICRSGALSLREIPHLIANGSEEAGSQGAAHQKSLLVFRTEKVNCLLLLSPPWG